MRVEVPHPVAGTLPLVANPIKFSRTPLSYDAHPPLLGEHTEPVLRDVLGKTPDEIQALRARGIL
jgi:formyl-CoA transferase